MPSTENGDGVQLENTEGGCQNSSMLRLQYSNDASKEGLVSAGVVKRTCALARVATGALFRGMPVRVSSVMCLFEAGVSESPEPTMPVIPSTLGCGAGSSWMVPLDGGCD